jgi:hypothetical protein
MTRKDCILRADAIKAMQDKAKKLTNEDTINGLCGAVAILYDMPSVTPQTRKGHWIRWYEQKETEWYIDNIPHCKCSECGKEYDTHSSQFIKYCPNCGADMREVEE